MNEFTRILTSGQLDKIKTNAAGWLGGKIDEGLIKAIIEPYNFDLVKDGISWLRSGTLSLCLSNSATNYKGAALEIELPMDKSLEEKYGKISTKLCHILMKHLQTFSGSNYNFPQVFKHKYSIWKAKVRQWLLDDFRQEKDWASCFRWLPWHGDRVRVELNSNTNEIYGDLITHIWLTFDGNGFCRVEDKRNEVALWMQNVVGGQGGLLDESQLRQADPYLAEAMVKTIRDKEFAHPYKPETIKKVVELKPALEAAAAKFNLNKLALAGAYADVLEKESSTQVQNLHDIAMEKFGKDVESFYKSIPFEVDALTSEILSSGASNADVTFFMKKFAVKVSTKLVMRANIAFLLWGLLPDSYQETIVNRAARFGYFWATLPKRITDYLQTAHKDEDKKKIIELALKEQCLVDPEEGEQKSWTELVSDAADKMSNVNKSLFRIYYRMEQDNDFVKVAQRIESNLGDMAKPFGERKTVHRVERFYNHFNA